MRYIAKEAREIKCWLNLHLKSQFMSNRDKNLVFLLNEIDDIINILTKIVKTSSDNLAK